jgi:hypothetical protein
MSASECMHSRRICTREESALALADSSKRCTRARAQSTCASAERKVHSLPTLLMRNIQTYRNQGGEEEQRFDSHVVQSVLETLS